MNDQNQEPISASNPPASSPGSQPSGASPSAPPTVYGDWREQRRAERLARREARWQWRAKHSTSWIGGAILILLGVVFLLQNMGIPFLANWWALFILIPAFWAFVAAWDSYQDNGRLTRGGALTRRRDPVDHPGAGLPVESKCRPVLAVLLIVGGVVLLVTTLLPV